MTPADAASGLISGANVTVTWDDRNSGPGDTTDNGTRPGSFYDYLLVQRVSDTGVVLETLVTVAVPRGIVAAGADGHSTVFVQAARRHARRRQPAHHRHRRLCQPDLRVQHRQHRRDQQRRHAIDRLDPRPLRGLADHRPRRFAEHRHSIRRPAHHHLELPQHRHRPDQRVFYDRVTIVNTTTGQSYPAADIKYDPASAGNGTIGATEFRPRQYLFTLPPGNAGTGDIKVTVTADYYQQVFEYNTAGAGGANTAESNNTANVTTTAAPAPYPNLVASDVTAPASTVGDPAEVTITWKVTNSGTGATTVAQLGRFDHRVARPAILLQGTVIKQFPHQGALAKDEFYNQSQTFLLPPVYQAHGHLFVRTDAADAVFENGVEADNTAEAANGFDVVPIPYADLTVTGVSADTASSGGQPINVSWTVTNVSPHALGTTNLTAWTDTVYLSSDPAGQSGVVNLGEITHIGALAVGGSYTKSATRQSAHHAERHVLRVRQDDRPVRVHLHGQQSRRGARSARGGLHAGAEPDADAGESDDARLDRRGQRRRRR